MSYAPRCTCGLVGFALSILGLPLWANADDYCTRKATVDPESPPGFAGAYEFIGKDPATGQAYAGALTIDYQKNAYSLTRTLHGHVVKGDAWLEECGMDKLVVLTARYPYKQPLELHCSLGADGGNYYRVTCRTRYAGQPRQGLEAWFQKQ